MLIRSFENGVPFPMNAVSIVFGPGAAKPQLNSALELPNFPQVTRREAPQSSPLTMRALGTTGQPADLCAQL